MAAPHNANMIRLFIVALLSLLTVSLSAQPTTRPSSSDEPSGDGATIVLVHGAWGGGWAFREVDRHLSAMGHDVYRATLTGQGERVHLASPEIDLETHINDVVNLILYEDLHDVVIMGHSYGGMVITGVVDRVPDRIRQVIYLDAFVPESGESVETIYGQPPRPRGDEGGFSIPRWVQPDQQPPHDVPQSSKTFSQPLTLTHQDQARALPTTYILTVDPGQTPEQDGFYRSYQRAQERGWETLIMEGDHNVQWSHPQELANLIDKAAGK